MTIISYSFPNIVAVVPAAGKGNRMNSKCPKQYLTIGHTTILELSVAKLLTHPAISRIVVVLSPEDKYFQHIPLAKDNRILSVIGGEERANSVLAGLAAARPADWVLVHDAVRPCLVEKDIQRLLEVSLYSYVGGILATPIHNTIKRSEPDKNVITSTVEREVLWNAMTPQLFPLELLHQCMVYALNKGARLTDEAGALEYCGYHPELIVGRSDNIKITRQEDLMLATYYLNRLHNNEHK